MKIKSGGSRMSPSQEGAVIPSHPSLTFLGTDSSCREGEEHKAVPGGGYRGATFLGFSGSFNFLEARSKAVIPLCSAATWTTQPPHPQPLQPIELWARERAGVGVGLPPGFGVGGGFGAGGEHGTRTLR